MEPAYQTASPGLNSVTSPADLGHRTGGIETEHLGLAAGIVVAPDLGIDRIDRDRLDPDQEIVRPRLWPVDLDIDEGIVGGDGTGMAISDGAHGKRSPAGGGPEDRGRRAGLQPLDCVDFAEWR